MKHKPADSSDALSRFPILTPLTSITPLTSQLLEVHTYIDKE
jgi:hypothetical protein